MPFHRHHAEEFQRLPVLRGVDQLVLGVVGDEGVRAGADGVLFVVDLHGAFALEHVDIVGVIVRVIGGIAALRDVEQPQHVFVRAAGGGNQNLSFHVLVRAVGKRDDFRFLDMRYDHGGSLLFVVCAAAAAAPKSSAGRALPSIP